MGKARNFTNWTSSKKVLCRYIGNEEEILNINVYTNSKNLPENFKMLLTKLKMYIAFSKQRSVKRYASVFVVSKH